MHKERDIRDSLASNIDILESGLTFVEKEHYIPSSLCTRSFIDLLARDRNGKLVLIEIKNTAAASREAIHEVLKYLEAVKQHLGIRENEIRVMVASTVWSELIVPFSSFVDRVSCEVVGLCLNADVNGNVVSSRRIDPLELGCGRLFSPYYELLFYDDAAKVDEAIKGIEFSCSTKNIASYVLVVLICSDEHPDGLPAQKQITVRGLLSEIAIMNGIDVNDAPMPMYKHVICFAIQQLDGKEYLSRSSDEDYRKQAEDILAAYGEEEALWELQDNLLALEPCNSGDFKDIANPAKLKMLIEGEKWKLDKVVRHGAFQRNLVLEDKTILSELCGSTGANRQTLDMEFNPSIKSEVTEVRRRVDDCLCDNQAWRTHIHFVLDQLIRKKENRVCRIHVYNPNSAITTIYLVASKEDGFLSIPTYHIDVPSTDIEEMYYGALRAVIDVKIELADVLNEFYEGSLENLLFTLNWGGYEVRDTDIMRRLGLRYKTIVVRVHGDDRSFWALDDGCWTACNTCDFIQEYYDFLDRDERFTSQIIDAYSSHWDGRVVRFDS